MNISKQFRWLQLCHSWQAGRWVLLHGVWMTQHSHHFIFLAHLPKGKKCIKENVIRRCNADPRMWQIGLYKMAFQELRWNSTGKHWLLGCSLVEHYLQPPLNGSQPFPGGGTAECGCVHSGVCVGGVRMDKGRGSAKANTSCLIHSPLRKTNGHSSPG